MFDSLKPGDGSPTPVSAGGLFDDGGSFSWLLARALGTMTEPFPDFVLQHLIEIPSVMLIVGRRGSGKTALGFRLIETLRYHRWPKFVVGVPRSARQQVPTWIKTVSSLWDLPIGAVALVDEAHLGYGTRVREADRKDLARVLSLSRQRDQLLIFASQQTRSVSREIVAATDVLIIKSMHLHQIRFERPEFEEALQTAQGKLAGMPGDRRQYSYVYAPDDDLELVMRNTEPSFWSEHLSRLYAGVMPARSLNDEAAERREESIGQARRLHAQGWSYGMIARRLGVSKGTAWNYVNAQS